MSDLITLAPLCPKLEQGVPDLDRYRDGNCGIPYVLSYAAPSPGPHVLLTAILHGNEVCGAIALDRLLRAKLRPKRGRLTFAFANVAAYYRMESGAASACRFLDEDLNRLWSPSALESRRVSAELRRARELKPVVDSADYLLDLHSMQQGEEALMLCGPLEKGRSFARALGYPVTAVSDEGHASGVRLRDYGAFGDPNSDRVAMLVECGPHNDPRSAEIAVESALRFLRHLDLIERRLLPASRALGKARLIQVTEAVTAASARFHFTAAYTGLEIITKAGTIIARDADRPIVTPYDDCVLVMPSRRCQPGQTAVRLGRVLR